MPNRAGTLQRRAPKACRRILLNRIVAAERGLHLHVLPQLDHPIGRQAVTQDCVVFVTAQEDE